MPETLFISVSLIFGAKNEKNRKKRANTLAALKLRHFETCCCHVYFRARMPLKAFSSRQAPRARAPPTNSHRNTQHTRPRNKQFKRTFATDNNWMSLAKFSEDCLHNTPFARCRVYLLVWLDSMGRNGWKSVSVVRFNSRNIRKCHLKLTCHKSADAYHYHYSNNIIKSTTWNRKQNKTISDLINDVDDKRTFQSVN